MAIVRVYFELLGLLPMPFEVAAFIFFTTLLFFWLLLLIRPLLGWVGKAGMFITELLIRLFLLPEYIFMSLLRLFDVKYVPGSGVYDDIVRVFFGYIYKAFEKLTPTNTRSFSYPTKWVFLIVILVVVAWYAESATELQGSLTRQYIQDFFGWYDAIKFKALSYRG